MATSMLYYAYLVCHGDSVKIVLIGQKMIPVKHRQRKVADITRLPRRPTGPWQCSVCGKKGESGYSNKRTCSDTCRVMLHRKRMQSRGYRRTRQGWVKDEPNSQSA